MSSAQEMAGLQFRYYLFIFYILLLNAPFNSSAKLNVPRVLLPLFQQFSTNFTLDVTDDGCYRWTSSRPDIVQVIPIEMDVARQCASKAVVSAITKEPTRNTVIVLAEDVITGYNLRCDVIVDVIQSLSVVTTSRELYMEEAPEMFEVRAINNQGNEFTTLEGVEFQWSIENLSKSSSGNQVLRFITFIDSPYETPATVEKFDALGLRGHMVLIEGVKTGAAKVSVQLPHSEYNNVQKIDVVLTVVANLLLDPPDTHILVGDTVKLRLLQMQHGRLDEIPLPSAQYELEVMTKDVLVIDRSVSVVRGLQLGPGYVTLRDRHTPLTEGEGGVIKRPTATVVVTQPAYLRLALLPHNNWAVLVDQPCTIQVHIFDRNNHRIHIGGAVTVLISISDTYFRAESLTRNGTVIDGTPIKVGTVPVTATLESVRVMGGTEVKLKPVISAQEEMLIYPQLEVTPQHVIVPWDPSLAKYSVELIASGGDGSYSWRSHNNQVAGVTQQGVVKCNSQGETNVIVSMSRNPGIQASSFIEVLPPSHIEILNHVLEAPVLKPIILHIVLYGDKADENGILKRVHFTHCQAIQFKVELSNEHFFQNVSDHTKPIGKACATVAVYGKVIGTSKVRISYRVKNDLLEASTEVAVFSPLEVVHPQKKVTVLALGTSRHIVWTGGPQIWQGRPAEHTRSITTDSSIVKVEEVSSNHPYEYYVYSVLCSQLGESTVVLNVKNAAANGNFKYTESFSSVKVICAKPRFITFSPETPLNSSCPYSKDSSRMVALINEPIKVIVTVSDAQGRVFDNATSFHVDWLLSSKSLVNVQYDGVVILEEKKEYNYIIPLVHYQIIHPKDKTGTLFVDASVVGYRMHILNNMRIVPESPPFWIENEKGNIVKPEIKNSLTISLVSESTITPDKATVFNHPNNKVVLKVLEGSGFFKFFQSSLDIAEVQYHDSSTTLEIVPKSDGLLQITLQDLCLSYKSPSVEIYVLKVGSMQVEMVDRVQKGNVITATVWLYDSVDNTLAVANSELLELRPHVEHDIVTVTRLPTPVDHTNGQVQFNITGLEIGSTSITFMSGFGEREIRSHPLALQVFSPLRLVPQDITLIVGAVYQVTPTGGPQPDRVMEYIASDPTIAKVTSSGLIEAQRVGDMSVTGMAVGYLKSTVGKIVYSEDIVNVHVIPLDGVKIHSPLVKIKAGCKMPVWAVGIPDRISPLVLGSVQPPLTFHWSTNTPDIVEVQDVFHATGVQVPDGDRLSMRVLAVKPGSVTLHLNVTMRATRLGASVEFCDRLDIEVFEELKEIKPKHHRGANHLMAPFTQMHLRTNKDSVSKVTYNVHGSPQLGWSVTENAALTTNTPVVSVSRRGVVTSHNALGLASVEIRTEEEYGIQQSLLVDVEVKPVHYIMINVNTRLHLGAETVINALPLGLDLVFTVTYHDNMGDVFVATTTDLNMLQNRFDTVKVVRGEVNGTLNTQLISYGPSVLKVFDKNTPTVAEDYFKLRVDHLITPSKSEVTVGDVICFSMPLLDGAGRPGDWVSGSPDVLAMVTRTGLARALKPGRALVKFSLTDTITTSTALNVSPVQAIVFLPLNGRNLTNWGRFDAALVLMNERDGIDKRSNLLAKNNRCSEHSLALPPDQFPFSCEIRFNSPMTPVDIHHVFHVQPSFSMETGRYSCHFEALSPPSSNTSILLSNVTLRAISDHLVSEPLVIPFLPSVYLPSKELFLTNKQAWTTFTVIGVPHVLCQVQVLSSDGSYMTVSEARRPDVNSAVYEVTTNSYAAAAPLDGHLYLHIFSPFTGQNISVPVHLNVKSSRIAAPCLAQPATAWLSLLETIWGTTSSAISLVVLVLVIWYSNVFNWARGGYPQPAVYATSSPAHVFHNGSPSPGLSESRSFLYRQPFADNEPVYGDPSMAHSPELTRRNRR